MIRLVVLRRLFTSVLTMGISCEIFTEFCFFKWDRSGSQLVVRLLIFSMISHFNNSSVLRKPRSIEKKKTKRKYEIKKTQHCKEFQYRVQIFKPKLLLPWILNSCLVFLLLLLLLTVLCNNDLNHSLICLIILVITSYHD